MINFQIVTSCSKTQQQEFHDWIIEYILYAFHLLQHLTQFLKVEYFQIKENIIEQ